MYRLELITDAGTAKIFTLVNDTTLTVGRHGSSDIVLDDPSVSRSHCLIYVESSQVEIEDLSSTNGVCVGGDRIYGRQVLPMDEELMIGHLRFILSESDQSVNVNETICAPMPTKHPKKSA